jgi:hypothetical protein
MSFLLQASRIMASVTSELAVVSTVVSPLLLLELPDEELVPLFEVIVVVVVVLALVLVFVAAAVRSAARNSASMSSKSSLAPAVAASAPDRFAVLFPFLPISAQRGGPRGDSCTAGLRWKGIEICGIFMGKDNK